MSRSVEGNVAILEDKVLSYKDDNKMSAWIHVPLSQGASVLFHSFTNSTAESFLGIPSLHGAWCLPRELDTDTADDRGYVAKMVWIYSERIEKSRFNSA